MTEQIKALKIRRGQLKTSLTRFSKFITEPGNALKTDEIKIRLEKVNEYFDEFDKIQSELETLDESEADAREELENAFFLNLGKARELVAKASLQPAQAIQGNANNAQGVFNNGVKLQPIELPVFSGGYQDWAHFHDTFKSLVHLNTSLDAVQKFHYLKTCLRDDALQVIENLQVSEANYTTAWTLLKERFENKRLTIQGHLKSLFEIPPIYRESSSGLRNIVDSVLKHTRALKALEQPTDTWDSILIYLISTKLDNLTKREWEARLKPNSSPTLDELTEFLKNRCSLFEALDVNKKPVQIKKSQTHHKGSNDKTAHYSFAAIHKKGSDNTFSCYFCKEKHSIYNCARFLRMATDERYKEVKKRNLCTNCLRPGHTKMECQHSKCRKCGKTHNTILHADDPLSSQNVTANLYQNKSVEENENTNVIVGHATARNSFVLLSTAMILINDKYGNPIQCRALLDSGSQSNFITADLSKKLQLTETNTKVMVTGIGQGQAGVTKMIRAVIRSTLNDFSYTSTFLILPKITDEIPNQSFDLKDTNIPRHIALADPTFNQAKKVDVLLGAPIFYELLMSNKIKLGNGKPTLQQTHLGWVLAGNVHCSSQETNKTICNLSLNQQLSKFWELEEISNKKHMSFDEQYCESYFKSTTTRSEEGRFIVRLPFNSSIDNLGNSKSTALKRLESVEGKFERDSTYRNLYINFMDEYLAMKHMTLASDDINDADFGFYLPHHAVWKESSSTTRLRVVFDGSASSDSGLSLNNCLRVGPTIQDDIFEIILRFRFHQYVMTADIEKMYRMIIVHPEDRNMQRIFWRNNKDEPIKIFTLDRLVYGLSSSPFLAIRCLQELAHQNKNEFPKACDTILRDFYVDDLLTGCDTIENAIRLKHDLISVLRLGGFELRKWTSNNKEILTDSNEPQIKDVKVGESSKEIKTLGIIWDSESDSFRFAVNINVKGKVTKRQILSVIAQIYDPLGLIGPSTIKAKIIMQKLWQLKTGWDDNVPFEIMSDWERFISQIDSLNSVRIPRHVICASPEKIQIHGYCDASEAAYGCCIYIRSLHSDGHISVNLLCAKSRVAPLKRITLPRLELCGAVLLAKLYSKVRMALISEIDQAFFWCDSKIVLAWIATEPCYLQTFVANRVSEINERTLSQNWKYINTKLNPADIISRGVTPDSLQHNQMWWHGPDYLHESIENWPVVNCDEIGEYPLPEIKQIFVARMYDTEILNNYSSLSKLKRVTAYILRFKYNALSKLRKTPRNLGRLSLEEMDNAMLCLIKISQDQDFAEEIHSLKNKKPLKTNSKLLTLYPFLDENGILRVGGRLRKAKCSPDQKHPILLSSKGRLTELIVLDLHLRNLHAGIQSLLSVIRLQYWPLSGRNAVKRVLKKCVRCFKADPVPLSQVMGDLPTDRCSMFRPFLKCGVDYAGPLLIKDGILRKGKIIKAYMCLFICFSTKAVHIELVSDLSTSSFLNAFKRFISRRGKPSDIYSDNGSNFLGASKELKDLYDILNNKDHNDRVSDFLNRDGIAWHFIPARSPHMGGLWEAAIKSAKFHLKRISSNEILTFEGMTTLLTQIEACLNSRPLTPISNDPLDYSCLTPSHFLIGDSLAAIPERNLLDVKLTRLSHFKRLQHMFQHFWSRWSKEYLGQLQTRSKWKTDIKLQPQPGALVLLKDETTPPMRWPLARIVDLHPGSDGKTRVVSVRSSSGTIFRRSITKICILPIDM